MRHPLNLASMIALLSIPNEPAATAPRPNAGKGPASTTAPRLTFAVIFPPHKVLFKNDIQEPRDPWSDGTVSRTLAAAAIPVGDTGAYISGARIVQKTKGQRITFEVQLPSSGRDFRRTMINCEESDTARRDLATWGQDVVKLWRAWRANEVKNGADPIGSMATTNGIAADQAMIDELGLGTPKPTTTTPAPSGD